MSSNNNNKQQKKPKTKSALPIIASKARGSVFAIGSASDALGRAIDGSSKLGLYTKDHRVLVVGDGNLSFSLALATQFGGANLTATVFDSEERFWHKYPDDAVNIKLLRSMNATVRFGVDATSLHLQQWALAEKFDRVVFNFPHTGVGEGTAQGVVSNQVLLEAFFMSARHIIKADTGEIHVALRTSPFYALWEIEQQAKKAELDLKATSKFDANIYVGYKNARTASSQLVRQAPSTEEALTYIFFIPLLAKPKQLLVDQPEQAADATKPTCLLCKLNFETSLELRDHASSREHKQAWRKYKTELRKRKQEAAGVKRETEQEVKIKTRPLRCNICDQGFLGLPKLNGHINSSKHAKKVKELKLKGKLPHLITTVDDLLPHPPPGSSLAKNVNKKEKEPSLEEKVAAALASETTSTTTKTTTTGPSATSTTTNKKRKSVDVDQTNVQQLNQKQSSKKQKVSS